MCLVCLASLTFSAIHTENLISNIIRGSPSGTISVSLLNNVLTLITFNRCQLIYELSLTAFSFWLGLSFGHLSCMSFCLSQPRCMYPSVIILVACTWPFPCITITLQHVLRHIFVVRTSFPNWVPITPQLHLAVSTNWRVQHTLTTDLFLSQVSPWCESLSEQVRLDFGCQICWMYDAVMYF